MLTPSLRHVLLLGLLVGSWTPIAIAQEGETHETLLTESIALLKSLNEALEQVKDEASAEKQVPVIKPLAQKMETILERGRTLPPLTDAQREALRSYQADVKQQTNTMFGHLTRIGKDKYAARLIENALQTPK